MRNLKTIILVACLAELQAVHSAETRLFEGVEPRPSPDGTRILHRVETPSGSALAIWRNGRRTWVDARSGSACYGDWTPEGGVIYTYGRETETAFAAAKKGVTSGFNLWHWDGTLSRQLTFGRQRDYAASVSPNGKTVYYTSTAEALAKAGENDPFANSASLYARPFGGAGTGGRPILSLTVSSYGAVGPRPSPDGRILVWAQSDGFNSTWRIAAGKASDPAAYTYLTPTTMSATAPTWSADGRFVAFTGFRVGDPGWGVYVQRLADGATKRLCAGENPAFAADGKSVYFDREGAVWRRDLTAEDWPNEVEPSMTVPTDDPAEAICARAEVEFRPATGFSYIFAHFLKNRQGGETRALQLFFRNGKVPEFATRRRDGLYAGVSWGQAIKAGEVVTLTGVRLGDALYISVNDQTPKKMYFADGLMEAVFPTDADLSKGMNFNGKIRSLSVTKGWPKELPFAVPLTRAQLTGGEK